MSSLLAKPRTNIPQAFVSSYAPRLRAHTNSLLTPVQPANVIPPLRTTKRGTTAINYSEDFDDGDLEDSDAPRRHTGLRSRRTEESKDQTQVKEQGRELTEPIELQAIWREWMGKPKRHMTERQVQTQAQLPINLVPIRIDLKIDPFIPEPPLPKPNNARELGLDENAPAYRQPEITPEYRLKDYFMWNLHEALVTPDQFAKVFVDELDFPRDRQPALIMSIAQQIRQQLEEHAGVEMHPFFQKEKPANADTRQPSTRPAISRDQSSTPVATPGRFPLPPTNGVNTPNNASTPLPNGTSIIATAQTLPKDSIHNPEDAYRCVISLSLNLQNRLLTDKFEWSLLHPPGLPEAFAKQTCADLGLSGEWIPALSHSIYEAVLKLKKEVCENGGAIAGIIGSGVTAWGEVENESAEVHGDGSLAVGEGAGWRFDGEHLGDEWEPRVETLSKEEIEKREGDRERQLRRMRRDQAIRGQYVPQPSQDIFSNSFGAGGGEEERMGRGERSKKKRRFRSLSPVGRDSPDLTAAFGGESGKLSDQERSHWHCSHCRIWGGAVWSVRDGPNGPRSLCNNCGLLYDQNKSLPPWSRDLYASERPAGQERPAYQTQYSSQQYSQPSRQTSTPQPQQPALLPTPSMSASTSSLLRPSAFVPDLRRAATQTFYRHNDTYEGPQPLRSSMNLPEQYAATVRGGGPAMFEDYAIEGEDLDWTKVTDPRERKRLQNIINGRKYRERRLAQEAADAAARGVSLPMEGSLTPGAEGGYGGGLGMGAQGY